MIAMAQLGRFAFVLLPILLRWMVQKLDHVLNGNGVWVTGRTGNVTVVTDKLF
jgi:hypothetical protein